MIPLTRSGFVIVSIVIKFKFLTTLLKIQGKAFGHQVIASIKQK